MSSIDSDDNDDFDHDDDDEEIEVDAEEGEAQTVMFVGGNPQAFIEHQMQMQDQANAIAQELRASVDRMFDELSPEHAYTLYRLLEHLVNGNPAAIHFMCGQLAAIIRVVHKACMTCGATAHETSMHGLDIGGGDGSADSGAS